MAEFLASRPTRFPPLMLKNFHGAAATECDPQKTGIRCAQGWAASNWLASRSNTPSPPNLAENCTPTGNPSAPQCNGTDIAGQKLILASWVNGVRSRFSKAILSTTPDLNSNFPPRSATRILTRFC